MIGLLCVLGLWAPNADIPLLDAAVAQVKAQRPAEAIRILEPIAQDAERAGALASADRLLLFYTLGRAYEGETRWCAAHDAFDRALSVRGMTPREARRLKAARGRAAGRRRGKMRVECTGEAWVNGNRRACPAMLTDLETGEEIEARATPDGIPARARARACRTVVLRMIDLPRGGGGGGHVGDTRTDEKPLPWDWVTVGILGAAAATTGVIALIKGGQHSELQEQVRNGESTDRAGVFALEDSTNSYAVLSGIFTLAAAGAVVWALWPDDADERGMYVTPGGVGWRF